MGCNVYYGDASRHDLLEIADAAKAKIIVIAISDREKRLELIETMGIDAQTLLGHRSHEANRAAKMFFRHDEQTLKQLSAIRNEEECVTAARESIEELERVMQADRNAPYLHIEEGWDDTTLIKDALGRL